LTKIFDNAEFWIESFVVARAAIVQGTTTTDLVLTRSGHFVGLSAVLDTIVNNVGMRDIGIAVTDLINAELTYGQEITGIRLRRSNVNVGAQTFGAKIMVFMRE